MLTKEECIKRLKEARSTIQTFCYINEAIDYAIKELQNPPLKFEELKEGSWVWDNKMKEYIKCAPGINSLNELCALYLYTIFNIDGELEEDYIKFEENRFYRREVNKNGII